ncbi:hypothetical protein QBC45DRAFT_389218 [Copromyces sp. CBS 386.78]|nr:hypothetical protein QBC45DRAFT_389218 [Copromyces sp. CBS 386.78]
MEESSEITITAPSFDAARNYSIDSEIQDFFKTSATREACDAKARELVSGEVVPVDGGERTTLST